MMNTPMKNFIDVAMGREKADLVIKGGNVINVYTGEIEVADIAIVDGYIAGVGDYDGDVVVDACGKYISPGFIDGHCHVESTMLSPVNFAMEVMPCGTTTCICDPHEIANVCGVAGVNYMVEESEKAPLDAIYMAPSCVPATPYENNGATIDSADIANMLDDNCYGVGEFMNAPGVVYCDPEVLEKLRVAKERGVVIDGHYPLADSKALNAYIGAGITTDHECLDIVDAMNKIRRGMYVLMREGSATRNVRDLIRLVTPRTIRRLVFCTDDKQVHDLKSIGHIDNNIKIAVSLGVSTIDAITIATLNAAECYKLEDRGVIAPGKIADLVIIDDLADFNILEVYKKGVLVAKDKKALFGGKAEPTSAVMSSVHCDVMKASDMELKLSSDTIRIIGLEPHNVSTKSLVRTVNVENGKYVHVDGDGFSKICVVERHKNTGNIGIALLEGYDIKGGAVALSVAHDSHNIIACGDNDEDIAIAINEIRRVGGGMTAVKNGKIYDTLELPIAGLMSDRDSSYIGEYTTKLNKFAYDELHVNTDAEAFMTLSFLSLVVIPELKISDRGLFDYSSFAFVPVEVS